ncbi:MAG: tungstate ABC transporter substrate-binding protein WtpA [Planctomycetota bacterium]|nr:tungstate ABC transporter substrate-binding protein WtpA [Planctomycetota bacterium]
MDGAGQLCLIGAWFLAGGLALGIAGCGERTGAKQQELIIFHAGSLSVPFRDVSALFTQQHPQVAVKPEAAGSRDTARKVSDLGRACDVLGAADCEVIDELLMPQHAGFNIRFASNELGIAYTGRSKMGAQINSGNWAETVLTPDVCFGRADPNSDPCGYRTLMLFQLAEKHLKQPGLAATLEAKHGRRFMRPKETDLLALLEAGEIDYLFIYRSVAQQHNLKFLRLPDELNLSSVQHAALYASATVQVSGKKPGETVTIKGAPIVYAVTIPNNAPHRELAVAYLALLLSPEGQAVMERHGQRPIVPAQTREYAALPEALKKLCAELGGR